MADILKHRVNVFTVEVLNDDKFCFNIYADSWPLCCELTFGEFVEFFAKTFSSKNHSGCFVEFYPGVKFVVE